MQCPQCHHHFRVMEDEEGLSHPCPACGHEDRSPSHDEAKAFLDDAIGYLDDNDPEAAIKAASDALVRIMEAL